MNIEPASAVCVGAKSPKASYLSDGTPTAPRLDFGEESCEGKCNYSGNTEHNEMTIKTFSKDLKCFSFCCDSLKASPCISLLLQSLKN